MTYLEKKMRNKKILHFFQFVFQVIFLFWGLTWATFRIFAGQVVLGTIATIVIAIVGSLVYTWMRNTEKTIWDLRAKIIIADFKRGRK